MATTMTSLGHSLLGIRRTIRTVRRSSGLRMRGSTRSRPRGVSLLEVMVAIFLVVLTAALVLPWTAGWLGDRELDQAQDQLAMQFMLARAAAREQGRPVEVVVEGGGDRGVEARWMSPATIPGDDDDDDRGSFGGRGDPLLRFGRGGDPSAIGVSWARFELPRGVQVSLDSDVARERTAASGAAAARVSRERGDGPQTLAIFLPDGTAVFAPIFLLSTDAGAIRALQVDRATGKPRAAADTAATERFDADDSDAGDADPAPKGRGR